MFSLSVLSREKQFCSFYNLRMYTHIPISCNSTCYSTSTYPLVTAPPLHNTSTPQHIHSTPHPPTTRPTQYYTSPLSSKQHDSPFSPPTPPQSTSHHLQVIGGLNQDRLTIAVARELEAAFGGWVDPSEKYKMYKYEALRGFPPASPDK